MAMLKVLLQVLGIKGKKKSNIDSFLDGEISTITSRDIDHEGSKLYDNYCQAMKFKERGCLEDAASRLEQSCIKPSIYKGHYRELFIIFRQWNKNDMKQGKYDAVSERVKKMIRYDDEMIQAMLKYWSKQQKRDLPSNHFDRDRNLKITDIKTLLKASEALNNARSIELAKKWITYFTQKKH